MELIYPYAVKYKGEYYPPNTPIVEKCDETVGKPVEKVENSKANLVIEGENDVIKPNDDKVSKPKRGRVKKDG